MKIFAILIGAMVALNADAVSLAEHKTMVIGIAQECKITENANDGDIGRLVEKKAPDTKEGKCLFACIIEQMDVVSFANKSQTKFSTVLFLRPGCEWKTKQGRLHGFC